MLDTAASVLIARDTADASSNVTSVTTATDAAVSTPELPQYCHSQLQLLSAATTGTTARSRYTKAAAADTLLCLCAACHHTLPSLLLPSQWIFVIACIVKLFALFYLCYKAYLPFHRIVINNKFVQGALLDVGGKSPTRSAPVSPASSIPTAVNGWSNASKAVSGTAADSPFITS
jgi:hypothetical protein